MRPDSRSPRGDHRPLLDALGIPRPGAERLAEYLDLLARWSERVNLTGARTAEERVRILVGQALPLVSLALPGHLIDVGSGNGSPGLVFAALRDDVHVTLLEPRARRWAFLREAARRMKRDGVEVVRARHDEYDGPPATTVTLRALRLPLQEVLPLVLRGGRVLVMGHAAPPGAEFEALAEPVPEGCAAFVRCST
jgi:16S rRNA (guanine527-N7)-methyltransferase